MRSKDYISKLLFVLLAIICAYNTSAQLRSKPNIIFIFADDLGYGDLGCYGQQKIATPNIDALAKKGVRFTNFYSGSTVCAPARCSFFTGMHTGHAPVRGNAGYKPEGQFPLPDSIITFPMLLQQNGYSTAAYGKWGLGFITTSGDPNKKGFDQFFGYNCQTLAHNYYPGHLWQNHTRIDLPGNLKYDSVYSADLIHQKAVQFLAQKHSKPFFLYLPYTLPHANVIVPHDEVYNLYVKKFNEQPAAPPKNIREENRQYDPYPHAAYASMVTRLDKYVGEIMNAVKQNGMEQNSLIIFTSDNGPHKEKGGDPVFFNSNGGFKGIKRDLYEGGIRVPFIVYKKGMTKAGSVNSMPVALYDLFPTFLELAGVTSKIKTDGVSLVPSFMGKQQPPHKYLYWEFHEAGGKQAVRMGNWKAVRVNVSRQNISPIELYDLKNDQAEKNNVAGKYPGIVKQMEKIMKEAHVPNKDWPLFFAERNVQH